ncbi:MAG TPA: sigma factor-like helix-turn-helix DNA-binding protein, partial [Thalassobaculum sp.]
NEAGREQVRQVLEQAIDAIPEPFRLVLILRDIQGFSVEETADLLSIRAATVKTRLFRAHKLIRTEIERALAPRFSDVFPFDGERCVNMADRVVARLR